MGKRELQTRGWCASLTRLSVFHINYDVILIEQFSFKFSQNRALTSVFLYWICNGRLIIKEIVTVPPPFNWKSIKKKTHLDRKINHMYEERWVVINIQKFLKTDRPTSTLSYMTGRERRTSCDITTTYQPLVRWTDTAVTAEKFGRSSGLRHFLR